MIAVGVGFSGAGLRLGAARGRHTSFSRMGADLVIVPQGALVNITSTLLTVQPTDLDLDESLGETLRAVPGVAKVAPQRLVRAGVEGRAINLIAYDPAPTSRWSPGCRQGSALRSTRSACSSARAAREKPGETLTICGRTLTIAGRLGQTGVGPVDELLSSLSPGSTSWSRRRGRCGPRPAARRGGGVISIMARRNVCRISRRTRHRLSDSARARRLAGAGALRHRPNPRRQDRPGNPVFTAARQSLGTLSGASPPFVAFSSWLCCSSSRCCSRRSCRSVIARSACCAPWGRGRDRSSLSRSWRPASHGHGRRPRRRLRLLAHFPQRALAWLLFRLAWRALRGAARRVHPAAAALSSLSACCSASSAPSLRAGGRCALEPSRMIQMESAP